MKKILLIFNFTFLIFNCAFSQAGEWVWIKGDSVANQAGSYGVQGVPSPTNNPPSLYEPCEWTDLNGNFWLFGGLHYVAGLNSYGDLWKYNPISNQWTWMKGSGMQNDNGSYGTQGIPSPTNNPPSRGWGSGTWVDQQGNLWMFGGLGYPLGSYSDLWMYNILTNEWTWVKGPNVPNDLGSYGIQGVPSLTNNPGSRSESAATWTDSNGKLWLFGGKGISTGVNFFNDLWRYDISSNEWTWMKGSLQTVSGVYGFKGIEDSLNTPGERGAFSRWKDSTGKLWLFAGYDFNNSSALNDLWKFNIITNSWTWMGGDSTQGSLSVYGAKCTNSSTSMPGARFENRPAWTDSDNNFWTFGGTETSINLNGWNDLWKYCVTANEWIWISGDNITNPPGHWGIQGVSSQNNKPNSRNGSVGWSDSFKNIYFFGGFTSQAWNSYNDLWKYTIDTSCGVCPNTTTIKENNPPKADELLVFPNPANSSLTISFSTSEKQTIELRIFNTLGKVQLSVPITNRDGKLSGGKFEKEINVEKLSNGIYFLQLKTKEGLINRKVMVEK